MARPVGTVKSGLKYLNQQELERFFRAVDKERNRRDEFLFRLILFLGLRVSEACQIKMKDMNFESYQIAIHAVKNGRSRVYDINGRLWRRLKRWLRERKDFNGKNPYLFPSTQLYDAPLSEQTVKMSFKRYAKQAGLNSDFSIHSLRHSCGIAMARAGESPISIMLWLRHKSIQSTQVYFEQLVDEEMNTRAKQHFQNYL